MAEKQSLAMYSQKDVVEWFTYLDKLRKSGATNMMGASPYLVGQFGLSNDKAKWILSLWMKTFDEKITVDRRSRVVYFANGGT